MTTSIVPAGNNSITVPEAKYDLVRAMFAKGCSETEFQVLIELANRYQLDPFLRQIWAVKYGDKPANIFVGRDGMLAIAHRSGQFNGMEPNIIYDADGKNVIGATCSVWRKDMTHPFVGESFADEDDQKQSVWLQRQKTMLIKVAMARALRYAFPITGLYLPEEFGLSEEEAYKISQRDSDITVKPEPVKEQAPAEPMPKPKVIMLQQQVDVCRENMLDMGMDVSVLDRAKLPDGTYNGDMINADFKRQKEAKEAAKQASSVCPKCGKPSMTPDRAKYARDAMNAVYHRDIDQHLCEECAKALWDEAKEAEEQAKQSNPAEPASSVELSKTPCRDCGKKVLKSEEKISQEKYGITLCPDCFAKRLEADIKKAAEDKALVQNLLASAEADTAICSSCGKKLTPEEYKRSMGKFGKPLCPECWIKQYDQKKE